MKIRLIIGRCVSRRNILLLIIFFASVLRLWKLGSIPPQLTPDEAALGYNSYSILKTGKDEYGKLLPIIFKSFGDYKPGLYIYLDVPFVAILGLNEFSTRLPSALAGIIAVWLTYKIILVFFSKKFTKSQEGSYQTLPLITAFVLAISPWHVFFSRGAWEANVALTLSLAGIYFFIRSLEKGKLLILSLILFGLTFITYQGAKLSTFVILFMLFGVFYKEVMKFDKRIIFIATFASLMIVLPIILSFLQGHTGRLTVFSVLSYPRPRDYLQAFLDEGGEKLGSVSYFLYHTEALNFIRGILGRYSNYFSGRFLIFEGDWQNPLHAIPNQGVMLFSDLVFLIAGLVGLMRNGTKKFSIFILGWLVLAPLPGALSRDQVQAVRSLNMVIPLVLIVSFGIYYLFSLIKRLGWVFRALSISFLISIFTFSFVYFLDGYFVHFPMHNAKYWSYGYKQVISYLFSNKVNSKVVFQQSYDQPYIYFLYYGASIGYQQFLPSEFQKGNHMVDSKYGDVGLVTNLGNIEFRGLSWPVGQIAKGELLVGNSVAIPDTFIEGDYKLLYEVKYPDNLNVAFRVLEKE